MHHADADPLLMQRNVVLALLLALAATAWALLVMQARSGDADMAMASPTMGMQAPLFLAIWVVMMVAMMFPTAAPMILTFHRIQASKRERGGHLCRDMDFHRSLHGDLDARRRRSLSRRCWG